MRPFFVTCCAIAAVLPCIASAQSADRPLAAVSVFVPAATTAVFGSAAPEQSAAAADLLQPAAPSVALAAFTPLPAHLPRPDAPTFVDGDKVWEPSAAAAALDATTDSLVLPAPDSLLTTAPDSTLRLLQGLSSAERQQRGRADAKRHYKPGAGAFWAGFGTGVVTTIGAFSVVTPLPAVALGAGGVVAIGARSPKPARLAATAPQPQLLRDADYQQGYAKGARGKKLGQTALGWGVGTLTTFGGLVVAAIILLSGGFS